MAGNPTKGVWRLEHGTVSQVAGGDAWDGDLEDLSYSNPFGQEVEKVWFDGKVVFAVELDELDVDLARVKVAQEYQIVYEVDLGDDGKLAREPDRVEGQFNIYDSVPGMKKYSPIWRFNYVMVPRDYEPNSLRSEADVLKSGYQVRKSNNFEN